MRLNKSILFVFLIGCMFVLTSSVSAGRRVRIPGQDKQISDKSGDKPSKGKEKPFKEMIKDKVKIEGLFTFYHDTLDNSMLMEITPDQMGPIYLCGMARAAGDGYFYDTGPLGRSFPFYFQKIGKKIQMMEKNLRIRADADTPMERALGKGISDHLYAALKIESKPQDSTEAVLVKADALFIRDAESTGYYLGKMGKTGFSFDKGNSYFDKIKSFPENTEIDVKLHFKSSKWASGPALQNGKSFYHTYHYSLSSLPETDYVPRIADERIGYFTTIWMDYSELDKESPYVRYIDRWHLKKKNPDARLSEPVDPIVFWIENTVPEEYRDAIAEGIEFWNPAYEKLGYRNAVVAKIMPDSADWDPLDVRYNTIRWMISPGVYAIGPSRANPFTGQIYDADISIAADFIRIMFNTAENFIAPVSFDGQIQQEESPLNQHRHDNDRQCTYAADMAKEAVFDMSYLMSADGSFADKDSLTREYVHSYIVELVAHEVGHTLGFRHNFKASTIYTLEQLQDREFTLKNSTVGTVMEYAPANIAAPGQPQGEFYGSVPGPFDYWRVEYGYRDFGATTPEEEAEQLKEIASASGDPLLAYATDFDRTGGAVDPYVNVFDLGDDPLAYCEHKIKLTRELWDNSIKNFEKPGTSYEKIGRVFRAGWRSYMESASFAARYIGGLHHSKSYIGDKEAGLPFKVVSGAEQKRAIKFLNDYVFAADAFSIDPELLNKLQSIQTEDFTGSVYRGAIAYPWHEMIQATQNRALRTLYSRQTIGRLLNNVDRADNEYTMYDMFTDVRRSIWSEITGPSNVNSHRRQLQLAHLTWINAIYLSSAALYPSDARTLAANDLDILEQAARTAVNGGINEMSRAHFKEVLRQIAATKGAMKDYSRIR